MSQKASAVKRAQQSEVRPHQLGQEVFALRPGPHVRFAEYTLASGAIPWHSGSQPAHGFWAGRKGHFKGNFREAASPLGAASEPSRRVQKWSVRVAPVTP